MNPRDALINLINAYADAKVARNDLLLNFAAQSLRDFLDQVKITPVEQEAEEEEACEI